LGILGGRGAHAPSKSASANETEEAELDNNAPSIDEIQEVTDSFCSNFPETK
jgi:hypothetical protein